MDSVRQSTITAFCIGENGVISVKWSFYQKVTIFFRRSLREGDKLEKGPSVQ